MTNVLPIDQFLPYSSGSFTVAFAYAGNRGEHFHGSVADRRIHHAASTLYHTWKGSFDDLVNEFNAAQNTPSVEEALETKHWSHAAFYPPVILFDDVVQVGTISNLGGTVPTVIGFVIHTRQTLESMARK